MPRTTSSGSLACLAAVLALTLAVAGCNDYGTRQFGTQRGAQDQTHVATPPPLSLPPILAQRGSGGSDRTSAADQSGSAQADSGASPSQASPSQASPSQAAPTQATPNQDAAPVRGKSRRGAARPAAAARGPSAGEDSLLAASGPAAPGDIREKVDEDAQIGRARPGFTDQLLYGQTAGGQTAGGQTGGGQTGGEPVIQREKKSWLDRIF